MASKNNLMIATIAILLLSAAMLISPVVVTRDSSLIAEKQNDRDQHSSGLDSRIIQELNSMSSEGTSSFEKIEEARKVNKDVHGWISIEDLGIDYPVLYSEDNKEYLRKDLNGNYSYSGCIYLDANYGDLLSPMKLIHGHNMLNGTFFSKVPILLKMDTLDNAPIIKYTDDLGEKSFKIFSVYSVNAKDESVIIDIYKTIDEIVDLKQEYLERSAVPITEVPDGIELLMLNTCWYGESGREHNLHCIVVAARIKE